jgi:hypothetical protein
MLRVYERYNCSANTAVASLWGSMPGQIEIRCSGFQSIVGPCAPPTTNWMLPELCSRIFDNFVEQNILPSGSSNHALLEVNFCLCAPLRNSTNSVAQLPCKRFRYRCVISSSGPLSVAPSRISWCILSELRYSRIDVDGPNTTAYSSASSQSFSMS